MSEPKPVDAGSYLALASGVVALGISPLLVRSVAASSLVIATYRTALTVPIGFAAMRMGGGHLSSGLLRRAAVGGLLIGTASIVGFWSLQETSVVNFMVITAMQPLIVGVLAVRLLGERPTGRQVALSTTALAAVVVLVLAGKATSSHPFGDFLALISVLLISGYMISMKHARNDGVHAEAYMAGVYVASAAIVLPIALLGGADLAAPRGDDWLWLVLLAITSGAGGHGLIARAQRSVTITVTAVASLASAVVATTGAWLVLDERLTIPQVVAAAVALAALGAVLVDQASRVDRSAGSASGS